MLDRFPISEGAGRGARRAMKAGAVDFLDKPVAREPLLAAVREALARGAERSRVATELSLVPAASSAFGEH